MKKNWFTEARFGMFIHWGLYAIPAGVWKGKQYKIIAEQIQRGAAIPAKEYAELAKDFNPVKFDADFWVQLAKDAGMKYVVLTTKHHDGFALFETKVSDFNIMDATPFKQDIVKALAESCAKHGLKFCAYYSQRQDWHEEDGAWNEWPNQFDKPLSERDFDFNRYMNNKALPQIKELLTNYGEIGLIWYDTATDSTKEQSKKFMDYVHELQPNCLVCDRVGNNFGDYAVLGDNEFPYFPNDLNGEVPATLNHTWGYKSFDHEWKSVSDLLYSLIRSVANGCNYLLNIGPDALGVIPEPSIERLREIGQWLKVNGKAIYGASSVPFTVPFDWGMTTKRGNKLYLIFSQWPTTGKFELDGVLNKLQKVNILGAENHQTSFTQNADTLVLTNLPTQSPSPHFGVIELEFDSDIEVSKKLKPLASGNLTLLSGLAKVVPSENSQLALDNKGLPSYFHENSGYLEWTFEINAGKYQIDALTNRHWSCEWSTGTCVEIECNNQSLALELKQDIALNNIQSKYHPESISHLGEITFAKAGTYTLKFSVTAMPNVKSIQVLCEDDADTRTLNLISLQLKSI